MGPEVVNKNKNCVFNGPYAGRDLYITMYQDNEREFVVTHNANIKPVAYFTGRETELQDLRQRIEEGRKSVLVSGMGGIGKTHICRKLFEEYLNKHTEDEGGPFRHIGYIEYNGDMGSSLQNCLKFKQQDRPEQNQEAAWRELEYLAADGKLLLFVDNVDRPIRADPDLQRLKEIPGAIILTSRQVSFGDEFEPYRIGFLGMEQCKEIFEKIRFRGSGRNVDPEEVPDLEYVIDALAGRHTITVEFLAYLARTKLWTVKRLREELEEKGFRLTFHIGGELVNIQESYEKLYDLSELTGAEQNILEAFSVFPYIPLAAETCNEWLLADAGASEDDDILMGLYQKGWLQLDERQEGYAMHPVFAQFICEKCKPRIEKHYGMLEECQKNLIIPINGAILECRKYVLFAESILKKMDMGKDERQIKFLDFIANFLIGMAESEKTIELYSKCLELCREVLGEENLSTATSYNNLAGLYVNRAEYEKAKEMYKKSLQIREKILGEEHPSIAISYNNLAGVYREQGENEKAKKLYKRSLQICKKVLGEEHPDTATSYNNLAYVFREEGEYGKAKELFEKSLQIREKTLGKEHPSTAVGYNNLAMVYADQKKYKIALGYCTRAYKISVLRYGANNSYTQIYNRNMKLIYVRWNPYGDFRQWLGEQMKETEHN